jgi:hypothetical protein
MQEEQTSSLYVHVLQGETHLTHVLFEMFIPNVTKPTLKFVWLLVALFIYKTSLKYM